MRSVSQTPGNIWRLSGASITLGKPQCLQLLGKPLGPREQHHHSALWQSALCHLLAGRSLHSPQL